MSVCVCVKGVSLCTHTCVWRGVSLGVCMCVFVEGGGVNVSV